MQISIDELTLKITYGEKPITQGQEALLDFLVDVIAEGYFSISSRILINQFGFSSILPLMSRLNRLIDAGWLIKV